MLWLYAIQEVAALQEVNQFTSLGSYCGAACTCFMTGKTVWLLSNLKPYHVPVYDAGSQVGLHMGLQCVTLSWSCWVSITLVYTVTDQCFLREWASNNMLNSRGEKIPRLWDGSDMRVCVRVLTVLGAFPVYEYIYYIKKGISCMELNWLCQRVWICWHISRCCITLLSYCVSSGLGASDCEIKPDVLVCSVFFLSLRRLRDCPTLFSSSYSPGF